MATPKQKSFPRVNLVKDNDTKQALVEIWNALHAQIEQVDTANSTITGANALIAELQSKADKQTRLITTIAAGGGISPRSSVGGGGSAGTSGGSGAGTPDGEVVNPPDTSGIPNQSGAVASAKADLIAAGVDITTNPCGPFEITNLAAFRLGGNYGLLDKPGGNQCDGYAIDIIAVKSDVPNPKMAHYNVLIDSEGAANPTWGFEGFVDADRWRPPRTPPI